MRFTAAFGSMVLVLAGCGYDRGSAPDVQGVQVSSVILVVASSDTMTAAGDTRLVTAVVKDAYQSIILAPSVSWRTSTPSVATVEGSGTNATVTAVNDGTATITAASGGVEGSITVIVRRKIVSIALSAPDSVVVAGFTTQLTVLGRDARGHAVTELAGASFRSSNPFSVLVSPTGLAIALFSSFRPFNSIIAATVTVDGVPLNGSKRIEVGSAAPAVFDFSALMEPEGVRPKPVASAAEGIVFLTRVGAQVQFRILWSLLEGPPTSAHIHGPDGNDGVAAVLVDLPLPDPAKANGRTDGSFAATDIRPAAGQPAISLDSLVALIKTPGMAYVDIHTDFFPDGVIRGSIFRQQ